MNPLRLRLRNFRCYDELDLEFPDGLTSIVGEVRGGDEGVESNGAGKSTIALAVDVALFGSEGREALTQYQTHGTEGMLVELEFGHRGETYRVRRSVSPKGKASVDFEQDTSDGWLPVLAAATMKDVDERVADTLGITRATFRASSLLLQGMVAFPELEPRDRVDLLSKMLGLERWTRRQVLVRAQKAQAETSAEVLRRSLEEAYDELAGLQATQESVETWAFSESEAKRELATAETALDKATTQYAAFEGQVAERRVAFAELEQARAKLMPLEERVAAGANAAAQMPALRAKLVELERLVKDGAEKELEHRLYQQAREKYEHRVRLENQAAILRHKAHVILDRAGEQKTCDRCGQTLGSESRLHASDSLFAEADELIGQIEVADEPAIPEPIPNEYRNAPSELGAANERLARLIDVVEQQPEALAKLAGFRADVATAEKRLARLPAPDEDEVRLIQQAGLDARARVNEAKGKVQEAAERATRARVELERLQKLDESTKEKREAREKLLANVDQLAILDRAYGRDGLPARYLENVALPHIEQAASRTLSRLGAGCRVQFQTERAKKSGGAKDELYVQVVWDNGDEQEYRHFSGGEKTRIALSIALALAEFLAGRDRASDLLVVDEPQFLDGAGMEALVEILRELNARVPKVMLVAHDPRLAEAFDQTIRVVREGGRSRLADGMVSGENPERGLDLPRETPSATSPGVAA